VFQVVTMMEDVVQRGTGTRAGKDLGRPIAGKTGTTQDYRDAWFAGFTPDLVTIVWVGFDQPADLGRNQTGGELAAPIWHDFMAIALKDHPVLPFVAPPGVTLANWSDAVQSMTDAFKDGQEPGASLPFGSLPSAGTPAPTSPPGDAAGSAPTTGPTMGTPAAEANGTDNGNGTNGPNGTNGTDGGNDATAPATGAAPAASAAAQPRPPAGTSDKAMGGLY
jgi:penicillin-binding protein 1A